MSGSSHFSHNGSESSSCNTLKEFFVSLYPFLFWVSFSSPSFGLVAISPRVPSPTFSPSYHLFYVSGCFVLFFIYSVLLFYGFLYPPHWGDLVICFSSCNSLVCFSLLLPRTPFFTYTLVFPFLCTRHILFWIMSCLVYCPHILSPVLCSRGKGSSHNYALFLPAEFPVASAELMGCPNWRCLLSSSLLCFLTSKAVF